jgi:hypothetical protein
MTGEQGTDKRGPKAPRFSDHLASLALPIAVIAFGVALSVGSDEVRAFVDLCRAALP